MLFVDYRQGSKELIAPLRKLGLDVAETTLDYGDVMFEGRGEKGEKVLIGIEFKKIEELVQALRTQRLQGHQLLGMRDAFTYSYLMYEGELLYDKAGALQQCHKRKRSFRTYVTPMPGQMTVNELLQRIYVLHLCGGLTPIPTLTRDDTLQAILALYRTWTNKDLDKHKSHIAAYEAAPMVKISDRRRTLKTFPHIGMRASLAVEQRFGSLIKAVNATPEQWAGIAVIGDNGKSKRLGAKAAASIVKFCKEP